MNIIIKDGEDAHPRIGAQLATSPREIEPVSKMYENNKITGAITKLCVTMLFLLPKLCPSRFAGKMLLHTAFWPMMQGLC